MDESKPAPPARSKRRDAIIVVAIIAVGLIVLAGTNAYLNGLRERALGGEWQSAVGSMRVMLLAAGALVALSTLALGAMLWRIGSRTVADGRFPPPGFGISDSREREGPAALRTGRFLQFSGVLVAVTGAAAAIVAFLVAPVG